MNGKAMTVLNQGAHDFLELWLLKKNSRVCHTASIQNPLKDTMFQEFQYVTMARSLSDRFS